MITLERATFFDPVAAETAVRESQALGYDPDDITLVMNEETRKRFEDPADW
jgi:hypothetical protein